MPPRFSYWTIILDGQPTAFRAAEPQELQPTLNQLRKKTPNAEMKWFARGKVWDSPEEVRSARTDSDNAAKDAALAKQRGRSWRPGGEHKDPREKFKKETFQAHKRREKKAANLAREAAIARRHAPPSDEARGAGVSAFAEAPAGTGRLRRGGRRRGAGAHQDARPERKAPDDRGDRRPFKPAGPPSPRGYGGTSRPADEPGPSPKPTATRPWRRPARPPSPRGYGGTGDPAARDRGSRAGWPGPRRSWPVEAEGGSWACGGRTSARRAAGRDGVGGLPAARRSGRLDGARRRGPWKPKGPAIAARGSRGRIVGRGSPEARGPGGPPSPGGYGGTAHAGRGSRRGPAIEARGSREDGSWAVDRPKGGRGRAVRLRPEATAGTAQGLRRQAGHVGRGSRGARRGPWKPKAPGDRGPWKPREDRGPGGYGPPRGDRPQGQGSGYGGDRPRGPVEAEGPWRSGPWKPSGTGDRGPWKPREDRGGPASGPPSSRGYGGTSGGFRPKGGPPAPPEPSRAPREDRQPEPDRKPPRPAPSAPAAPPPDRIRDVPEAPARPTPPSEPGVPAPAHKTRMPRLKPPKKA